MRVVDTYYNTEILLDQPITFSDYLSLSMNYFDRDGFELNELEQALYKANSIPIDEKHLNHVANHFSWIEKTDEDETLVIDHSCLAQRWGYTGQVKEDLLQCVPQRNELRKLLNIIPKWGFDFNLDYVGPDGCTELFHIECDRNAYYEILELRYKAEMLIISTDWMDFYHRLKSKRSEWAGLSADDQIEWKVTFMGWPRTYDTRKVFI